MASLLGAAGCVSVPTSGPIEKVEGQQQGCQNCVNVEVAPPAPGDEPRQIVEGYLRATSNYQPNYSVAKQFLTRMAAEKWSPEGGVSIYRGSPTAVGPGQVGLKGWLVGSLGSDRTYMARDRELSINFVLAKENGEWRINNPPPGLMVAEYSFTSLLPALRSLLRGERNLAGSRPDLPSRAEQPCERRLGPDEGAAQWTFEVAEARRLHGDPAEHQPERRLGDDHRRHRRGAAQ